MISKLSQQSAQSKNLAELDVKLCINFSAKTGTNDIEKYELCDELIKISRKSRYSPLIKNIPGIIQDSFSDTYDPLIDWQDLMLKESLYYVAGWTVNECSKVAVQRNKKVAYDFNSFVTSVSFKNNDEEKNVDFQLVKLTTVVILMG